MWIIYAFISAISAALVAIFGKLGIKDIDSTFATTIRSIIMAVFLILVSVLSGKMQINSLADFSRSDWIYIILAGVAGAVSWLFYFLALKFGPASQVAVIDRLSIVFVIILSALFLNESLTWKSILGMILIATGAILIVFK